MSRLGNVVDLPQDGVERVVARFAIEELRGQTIANFATGIAARLSASAKGKLISNKATGKSKANGFTREQHNAIVAHIGEVYRLAVLWLSRPDRDGDVNIISIKRFATKVCFGSRLAVAWITVKESKQHGHRIYCAEL